MPIRYCLFISLLSLAACTAHKPPDSAPITRSEIQQPAIEIPQPPVDSLRHKIIETAAAEWEFFGKQIILIDREEESIPHVGLWEDDDFAHITRINQYWRVVDRPKLSGEDCNEPWSAAFISWIMQSVGIPAEIFPPAVAHKLYLSHILAKAHDPDARLIPHTILDYKPKPGDLICANRGNGYFGDVVTELPQELNSKLHCDIVVHTDGKTLEAIGGNVRNSVSKTRLKLNAQGYLPLSSLRPWFLIVENRL